MKQTRSDIILTFWQTFDSPNLFKVVLDDMCTINSDGQLVVTFDRNNGHKIIIFTSNCVKNSVYFNFKSFFLLILNSKSLI